MSPQNPIPARSPLPIMGILAPGEERTRRFPLLPVGIMPLLQSFPGSSVELAGMGRDYVTVRNSGDNRGVFTILFVTQGQVKKLRIAKEIVDMVSDHRKQKS